MVHQPETDDLVVLRRTNPRQRMNQCRIATWRCQASLLFQRHCHQQYLSQRSWLSREKSHHSDDYTLETPPLNYPVPLKFPPVENITAVALRLFLRLRLAPQQPSILTNCFLHQHLKCSIFVHVESNLAECDGVIFNAPSCCSANSDSLDTCNSHTFDTASCVTETATPSRLSPAVPFSSQSLPDSSTPSCTLPLTAAQENFHPNHQN